MNILETAQFVILALMVAILMWDNRTARPVTPLRIRVRRNDDRHGRR
jgi:hypothetical protein